MVRKNLLIGAALAAALLAGCSGTSNDGNASADNTTSSSTSSSVSSAELTTTTTSTSTSTTSSSTSSTASTSADDSAAATTGDDDDATGSVQPAALDEQSKVWFGTFCTGLTGAFTGMTEAMGGGMSGAGTDPKAAQAALVSGYQQVAAAFSDTASNLSGLPAPTVDGGDQIATQLPGALNALGEGFATATEKFAAAEVTDEASLTAAMDAFTAETEQYGQQLETEFSGLETTLTPEIGAAVQALPECAMMGS